jgi:selenide,water dikinase
LLDNVLALADAGVVTGASERNWGSYGDHVRFVEDAGKATRALLCDPQTSGGLLVSCAPDAVPAALEVFKRHGCERAARIGTLVEGAALVEIAA